MADRVTEVGGIWADGAPNVPGATPPVPGVTYGDTGLLLSEITAAWPYSNVVNSATHNEIMRRITTLLTQLEAYGILPWSALTTYVIGSLAVGSDGGVYRSLVNPNLNLNPISQPTKWRLVVNDEYWLDTGVVNTLVITPYPAYVAHPTGVPFYVKISNTNTLASTLNPNGLGAKPITINSVAITAGTLVLNSIVLFVYDGTNYEIIGARYTDTQAVSAMGAKADSNPLNHDKARFDEWVTRSNNTIYQETTDIVVVARTAGSSAKQIIGRTDATATPSEIVANVVAGDADQASITFPVRAYDYWRVTGANWVGILKSR